MWHQSTASNPLVCCAPCGGQGTGAIRPAASPRRSNALRHVWFQLPEVVRNVHKTLCDKSRQQHSSTNSGPEAMIPVEWICRRRLCVHRPLPRHLIANMLQEYGLKVELKHDRLVRWPAKDCILCTQAVRLRRHTDADPKGTSHQQQPCKAQCVKPAQHLCTQRALPGFPQDGFTGT